MTRYCVRKTPYNGAGMLNICDSDLLGRTLTSDDLTVRLTKGCYGKELVDETQASEMLRDSAIINMAGEGAVGLSIRLGVGSEQAVRKIGGVPFLLVFKM